MATYYEFPCGCKFKILGTHDDGMPKIKMPVRIEEMSLKCERTWDLISSGNTKGIFQLESNLGKTFAHKLKPRNIEHLSALMALLRPGCLASVIDGKTITQHYIDRKNGEEPVEFFHPALEPILSETYGEMCIHEDTYISMANGTEQQVRHMVNDSYVQSLNENTYKICQQDKCIRVVSTRKEHGLIIRLENGYTITLTKDHKVLTNEGWVEACSLNITKHVVASSQHQHSIVSDSHLLQTPFFNKTENCAYFIGQMVGDGCSGSCISTGIDDNHQKTISWLEKYSELLLYPYKNKKGCNYIGVSHPLLIVPSIRLQGGYGNRKTVYRKWIESLGLHKTKRDKVIPQCIYTSKPKERRAFLAGLLDSDGHIGQHSSGNTCVIHYCSDNPAIINGVRKLLAIDGIVSYVSPDNKHIYIKNTKKFINLVGQYLVVKVWTDKGYLLTGDRQGTVKTKDIVKHVLKNHKSIRSYLETPRGFSRASLCGDGFSGQWVGVKINIDYGDITWMRIKSITQTPTQEQFYSISIEVNHNVIANGIVVKNCYQEQAMRIAQDIAGFDLQQADTLRKSIGKKIPELMAECKIDFLAGAAQVGVVTTKEAEEIFSWIEKSQRYAFNKSHSVSYALNAYLSAYIKAHFPRAFFTSYLYYACNKQKSFDEISALTNNARMMNIDVLPPNFTNLNVKFKLIDGKVYFGLSDIKGIGESSTTRLLTLVEQLEKDIGPRRDWSWIQFLTKLASRLKKTTVHAMIKAGALPHFNMDRTRMLFEYDQYSQLNTHEQTFLGDKISKHMSVKDLFQILIDAPSGRQGGCSTRPRKQKVATFYAQLINPPHSLQDSIEWTASVEEQLLGLPLTCTVVDSCDINAANCTCKDIADNNLGHTNGHPLLACQIIEAREIKTKKGKNPGQTMAFLQVSDSSGELDSVVVFPDNWKKYRHHLTPENIVMLGGSKDKTSFIVEKVWQI